MFKTFYFLFFHTYMRSLALRVVALLAISPVASTFAADASGTTTPPAVLPDVTTTAAPPTLSAATSVQPSAGSALGEYTPVNCNSNATFAKNNCDQCFDGGNIKINQRLTGLFDTWTNNTNTPLTIYKDEQKLPEMIKFGTWTSTPASEAGIWKTPADIVWSSGSGSRASYILSPGTKVRFVEADVNAWYTLTKTDKKHGEVVGMLRFPIVSRVTNTQTATDGAPDTHYECVVYKLDAPTASVTSTPSPNPTTPSPTIPQKPKPENMTQTETGPETLLLIAAAFFIAFGLMMTLRKRS
jgi:hypothetical protein